MVAGSNPAVPTNTKTTPSLDTSLFLEAGAKNHMVVMPDANPYGNGTSIFTSSGGAASFGIKEFPHGGGARRTTTSC